MSLEKDKKILDVLNNSTTQLATPVAIFIAGYLINNNTQIPDELAKLVNVISLALCFLAGYFVSKVSYVARHELRQIGLSTFRLYGYFVVITFLHLVLFIVGAYAVLGK